MVSFDFSRRKVIPPSIFANLPLFLFKMAHKMVKFIPKMPGMGLQINIRPNPRQINFESITGLDIFKAKKCEKKRERNYAKQLLKPNYSQAHEIQKNVP